MITHQDEAVTVHHGDALLILRELADCSVDSVVCDPPYGLEFMGREWDKFKGANDWARAGDTSEWSHRPKGGSDPFNGRDRPRFTAGHPFQQWCQQWATECLRVLKPGGYLLAFGGTRTWHRLTCGIEDRGQLSMPNLGAVRRLQALSALGWSMSNLATQLGMTSCRVYHLRSGIHPTVYATTHRKISDLYERLCMTLPPDTAATRRTRAHASRLGWFPPLAWDDIDDPDEYPGLGVLAEADAA